MDYNFSDMNALTPEQMDIVELKRTTQTLKLRLENFDLFKCLEQCGCGCEIDDLANALGMIEPWQAGIVIGILKTLSNKLMISKDELSDAYRTVMVNYSGMSDDDDSMEAGEQGPNREYAMLCEATDYMNKKRGMKVAK